MRFSSILIASTLISCLYYTKKEEEMLERLKSIYGTMPTDKNGWVSFANDIDSILNKLSLWIPRVFNNFAPFLLHSGKHKEKLNGFDLRLVYETKNENLKKHWIDHANKELGSLRCSFIIDKLNDDDLSKEILFCNNFSNLTKVELRYSYSTSFDKSKTWSNSMEVLSNLKKIPACNELELNTNDLTVLKYFIDGAATSDSDVLQQLKKLKIGFDNSFGILYLNSAVKNFPSLFTSLKNLSEITIENQARLYLPEKTFKPDNLVNLIEKLPKKIAIKLIGRCIESNESPEFVNALKEEQIFANALKKKSHTGNVSIVYKFDSFDKKKAQWLRDKIGDSKLDITILDARNGTERHLPITTKNLENLLNAKDFNIGFNNKQIEVEHTSVNDFLSSFRPFFEEREWEWVIYKDKNLRTEICKLPEFVETFNKCKYIRFESNFLDISDEKNMSHFISVFNNPANPYKKLSLYASEILIDSKLVIPFCYEIKKKNVNFNVKSWLIRVRNRNMDAFKDKFEEIYKTLYPEGLYQNEFLDKIEALSKLSKLVAFTINLREKDVIYIDNGNFDHVLQVLKTIKNMFEKVIVAKKAFTVEQIEELREELRNGGSCRLEILTEESLLNSWLRSQ
ncbi:hypothetical protein GINT2_001333 [Glugoides intestinalis]